MKNLEDRMKNLEFRMKNLGDSMTHLKRRIRGGFLCTLAFIFSLDGLAQNKPVEVSGGYKIAIQTSGICELCQHTLEKDLTFEKGVKEALLNLDDKVMTIVYNPKKTNPDILRERITKVGYHADWMPRDSTAYEKLPFCCKDGSHGTPIPQIPTNKKGQ